MKIKDFTLLARTNAKNLIFPSSLVQVRVKKVLENGLLVRFLSAFYGFIFIDHLKRELKSYGKKELLEARILATDLETKLFHLSENPKIL